MFKVSHRNQSNIEISFHVLPPKFGEQSFSSMFVLELLKIFLAIAAAFQYFAVKIGLLFS